MKNNKGENTEITDDNIIKSLSQEIANVRYLVARNELFFLRLLAKVALGHVLTEQDLLNVMSEAKGEMSFEDVKANIIAELER